MGTFHVRMLAAVLAAGAVKNGCFVAVNAPIQPISPDPQTARAAAPFGANGSVDLSLGRVTEVEGVARLRFRDVGGEFGPYEDTPIAIRRVVTGDQTPVPGGATYRVETTTDLTNPEGGGTPPDLWRQDRSGLYLFQEDLAGGAFRAAGAKAIAHAGDARRASQIERALAVVEQRRAAVLGAAGGLPVMNARGPRTDEITFLRYPLHPNASWDGRPGFNVWYFEAWEDVATPAGTFRAARVRVDVTGQLGPNDVAQMWWAEPGETRRHFHFVADMTDENGQVIGQLEADETFLVRLYAPAGVTTGTTSLR